MEIPHNWQTKTCVCVCVLTVTIFWGQIGRSKQNLKNHLKPPFEDILNCKPCFAICEHTQETREWNWSEIDKMYQNKGDRWHQIRHFTLHYAMWYSISSQVKSSKFIVNSSTCTVHTTENWNCVTLRPLGIQLTNTDSRHSNTDNLTI